MWWLLVIIIMTVVGIKLVKVSSFWNSYDIPHESYLNYLHRMIWRYNTGVVEDIIREDVKKYGPVYGSYRGFTPSLVVSDIAVAKEVLIKQFSHFFSRTLEIRTGDPIWDNTIVNLPYNEWKALRTIMGYTFTASKMRGIIPKFHKISQRLVAKMEIWAKSPDNHTVALRDHFKAYTLDSMAAVSFGIDPNCIDNADSAFMKHSDEFLKPGLTLFLFFTAPQLMKYVPFVDFPSRRTSQFFGHIGRHALKEKRKNLDQVIANDTADILDLHLIAQREHPDDLSDDILASQAFLFFIAGVDGVTSSLTFVLYNFAIHPDVQEKAFKEVMGVLNGRAEIQYDDVQNLKYLNACILEANRLAPQVALLDRVCTRDTELNGMKIHKGMVVEFAVRAISMDPKNFPEPERFLPERFLTGRNVAEGQDCNAFLIFGDGPRNCVGRRLAIINAMTLLANILFRIRVERAPETPYPLKIKKGLNFSRFEELPLAVRLIPRSMK